MEHLKVLALADRTALNGKSVQQRAAGQFYTHRLIGQDLAVQLADRLPRTAKSASVLDPFCGDGRLVVWLVEELGRRGVTEVQADLWDQDAEAVAMAVREVCEAALHAGIEATVTGWSGDTFSRAVEERDQWDLVTTNPPWELLKPDHREMRRLPSELRESYVEELRAFDRRLTENYPMAQPSRRFAGWGTNLSRVGTEVALRLTANGGACGVVCPTSLLADSTTASLRAWILDAFSLEQISHFPAEARLFDAVDVPCCSFVAARRPSRGECMITQYGRNHAIADNTRVVLDTEWLAERDYSIPVQMGARGIRLLRLFDESHRWTALESDQGLWAGRELDETRRAGFTLDEGTVPFVRSLHITRLTPPTMPSEFVDLAQRSLPESTRHTRLAWRDISRPSQARRVHATLLPAGCVTGNSLSVAYFKDDDSPRLLALLGVVSSTSFEFQVRSLLMTNHVSLSVMRAARVPMLDAATVEHLAAATYACLEGGPDAEAALELAVARAYELPDEAFAEISEYFEGLVAPNGRKPTAAAP